MTYIMTPASEFEIPLGPNVVRFLWPFSCSTAVTFYDVDFSF